MPAIEKEFFDRIIIEYLDIAQVENYKLMLSLKEQYFCTEKGTPTVFFEGKILVGFDQVKDKLREVVKAGLLQESQGISRNLPTIDLLKRFMNFGVLTIVGAGLLDGINPCAFTVIVFFISFLALQGYRKRELLIVSLSFIFAVFVTYILIGLGIFRFLYALQNFHLVTRIVYFSIAGLCFFLGGCALYDLWIFKKTGKTDAMALQLPSRIKNTIHALIGERHRRTREETMGLPQKGLGRLIIGALGTGFMVSILEGICTGQMYLPTITFVLKETSLKARAFAYLVLYNLMFIVPLLVIMTFALLGVTSEGFGKFLKAHMVRLKLGMAILFFGLGILILLGA